MTFVLMRQDLTSAATSRVSATTATRAGRRTIARTRPPAITSLLCATTGRRQWQPGQAMVRSQALACCRA